MGISTADLDFIQSVANPKRVCDLGDQDLIGLPDIGPKSRDYWVKAGAEYIALDVFGDCVHFDLNTDSVPRDWEGFDLVTNCGDTEHVMNQLNCFTVIHDLCKIGGVMYHSLPICGYATHGFFNYNLKFFTALWRANRYEMLKQSIVISDSNVGPSPDERMTAKDGGVRIALRKLVAAPFRIPVDAYQPLRSRILERAAGVVAQVRHKIHRQ